MFRRIVLSSWFALADVVLILVCGVAWVLIPYVGMWITLIALLPWILRLLAGVFPFQRTAVDWLIVIFLVTAWVGYWASYDTTAAWNKAWIIVLAALLYYALSAQPKQNLLWISFLLFTIAVGTSLYYFLTHDFVTAPRKLDIVNHIGRWIMDVRPQTGWSPIHPNYAAGIVAVTVPFIFAPLWELWRNKRQFPAAFVPLVMAGLLVAGFALVMATSRGVVLAVFSGIGAWLLWRTMKLKQWQLSRAIFPAVLLVYLCAVVIFLYLGPAQPAGGVTGSSHYGNGSRAELFSRSVYLLQDFPLTGGGLGAFPGLFSQYLLNIPYYYLPNSHNLFLDVAIEQGLVGGLAFLFLYLAALWRVSRSLTSGGGDLIFQQALMFSLIVAMIHGMVDNYLYNGMGSFLSLFLVGLSMKEERRDSALPEWELRPGVAGVLAAVLGVFLIAGLPPLRSIWYANLGAVRLAQVELQGFPNTGWAGSEIVPRLDAPEGPLRSALQLDPDNRTANHRLGLISMLRGDFESAAHYLEIAHEQSPGHRGILKSLGYCYVWLGEFEKSQQLLSEIPEANNELGVYVWWWDTHGRSDLSKNASDLRSQLKNVQP